MASDGDDGGPLLPEALQRICGDLPIRRVVLDVLAALNGCSGAVLQAPPGAGKTTTVPLALLQHNPAWLRASSGGGGDGRPPTILVLEPRRVAAKAAARRMAAILGEKVSAAPGRLVRLVVRGAVEGRAPRSTAPLHTRAQVGATVGYRVRLETCVSKRTRIEVVTEGERASAARPACAARLVSSPVRVTHRGRACRACAAAGVLLRRLQNDPELTGAC